MLGRARCLSVLVLAVLLCASVAGGPAADAGVSEFQVNSFDDGVDASPGDGVCETGAGNGVCTLRAAVQEGNALPGTQQANLAAGTYTLSIPGASEDNAATGDLDINDSFTVAGADVLNTTIDGASLDRVFHVRGGTNEIRDVTIQRGLEDSGMGGGGIYNTATLNLLRSAVILNWTTLSGAGASNASTMTIAQTTIDSNHAEVDSGGVSNSGQLEIVDSTISNNVAERYDAGIDSQGTLTVMNSTISGNQSTDGVGVKVFGDSSASIRNSTIAGNEGGDLGGIRTVGGSATTITNTIVAGNSGDQCVTAADSNPPSTLTSGGHNLASDGSCSLSGPGDIENTSPLLGPLAANGGFTRTHALLQGSPAVDAGDDAECPNQDQRGTARPQGTHCDIGAYEATGDEPEARTQGDVDCDTDVDTVDSLKQLRHTAGLSVSQEPGCPQIGSGVASLWGDVDCDDDVDSVDALKVQRHVAALPVQQDEPCADIGTTISP